MPLSSNNSVNSAGPTTQDQAFNDVEPGNATAKKGAHKVSALNPDDVERLIPTGHSGQAEAHELLKKIQNAKAENIVGNKNAPEAPDKQLNAILYDKDLERSYKEQAKDSYLYASLHTFYQLQSFVDDLDPKLDSKGIAKAYKKKLKTIKSELKDFERNTSDLKVTVTTRGGVSVQLIPFTLEKIEPENLKELLGLALALTEEAKAQRVNAPDAIPKGTYERKIASCEEQIASLMQQVDPQTREACEARFNFISFPTVQFHFDGGTQRPAEKAIEKTTEKNSLPDITGSKLDIANTGKLDPKTTESEELRLQKNTESTKAQRKEYFASQTDAYSEEEVAKDEGVAKEIHKAITGIPYSSLGEVSDRKGTQSSKAGKADRLQEIDDSNNSSQLLVDNPEDDVLVPGWLEETASSTDMIDDQQVADNLYRLERDQYGPDITNSKEEPPQAPSNDSFNKFLQENYPEKVNSEEHLKNSKPRSQPVSVGDKQQFTSTGTNLLEMTQQQASDFKKEKLWNYMGADQIVRLYGETDGLIPTDVYIAVKDEASMNAFEASKDEIPLPTFEALLEKARKKQVSLPVAINVTVENDGVGLFRALLAYKTKDDKWLSSKTASKKEVCEMIKSDDDDIALHITSAIEKAIEKYQKVKTETDAWKTVVQKLNENDGEDDVNLRIFYGVMATGEFSGKSSDDLADLLSLKPLMTTNGVNDPFAVELGKLANLIYESMLSELGVPMSDGNKEGLWSENGQFSLVRVRH